MIILSKNISLTKHVSANLKNKGTADKR